MSVMNGDEFDELDKQAALLGIKLPKRTPKIPVTPNIFEKDKKIASILEKMRGKVREQESSNGRSTVNPDSGALGDFQVMPSNIPQWTKQHYGKQLTPQEFQANKDAQRAVFDGEMGKYLRKAYDLSGGDEEKIIRMGAAGWYGGEGAMKRYDDTTPQFTNGKKYPSFRDYTTGIYKKVFGNRQQSQQDDPFTSLDAQFTKLTGQQDPFADLDQQFSELTGQSVSNLPVIKPYKNANGKLVAIINGKEQEIAQVNQQPQTPVTQINSPVPNVQNDQNAQLEAFQKAQQTAETPMTFDEWLQTQNPLNQQPAQPTYADFVKQQQEEYLKQQQLAPNRVPETPDTINAQIEALTKGTRQAVVLPPTPDGKQPQLPTIPNGFVATTTPKGIVIHNPQIVSVEEIQKRANDNTLFELQGIVEPESETTSQLLIARDKDGKELQAVYVSPDKVGEQTRLFRRQFPNAKIIIADAEKGTPEVLAERRKNYDADQYVNDQVYALNKANEAIAKHTDPKILQRRAETQKKYDKFILDNKLEDNEASIKLFNESIQKQQQVTQKQQVLTQKAKVPVVPNWAQVKPTQQQVQPTPTSLTEEDIKSVLAYKNVPDTPENRAVIEKDFQANRPGKVEISAQVDSPGIPDTSYQLLPNESSKTAIIKKNDGSEGKSAKIADADILRTQAGKVGVDLRQKPKGMSWKEFFDRASLKALQSEYGYTDQQINDYVASGKSNWGGRMDYTDEEASAIMDNLIAKNKPFALTVKRDVIADVMGDAQKVKQVYEEQQKKADEDLAMQQAMERGKMDKPFTTDSLQNEDASKAYKDATAISNRFNPTDEELRKQAEYDLNNDASSFWNLSGKTPTQQDIEDEVAERKKYGLKLEDKIDALKAGQSLNDNSFINDLYGGQVGNVAKFGRFFGGLTRPLASLGFDAPYRGFREMSEAAQIEQDAILKDTGRKGQILSTISGLTYDLPVLIAGTKGIGFLGKGAGFVKTGDTIGNVLFFGLQSGAEKFGTGASKTQTALATTEGLIQGGVFSVASKLGKTFSKLAFSNELSADAIAKLTNYTKPEISAMIKNGTIPQSVKNTWLASKLLGETVEIGTIAGGTYATKKAFDASNDEALDAAIVNSIFHLTNKFGEAGATLAGKVIRYWKDSSFTDIYVDLKGNINKLKNPTPDKFVDAEIIAEKDLPNLNDVKNVTPKNKVSVSKTETVKPINQPDKTATKKESVNDNVLDLKPINEEQPKVQIVDSAEQSIKPTETKEQKVEVPPEEPTSDLTPEEQLAKQARKESLRKKLIRKKADTQETEVKQDETKLNETETKISEPTASLESPSLVENKDTQSQVDKVETSKAESDLVAEYNDSAKNREKRDNFFGTKGDLQTFENSNAVKQRTGETDQSSFNVSANGNILAVKKGNETYAVPKFDLAITNTFVQTTGKDLFKFQGLDTISDGRRVAPDNTSDYEVVKPAKVKINNGKVEVLEKGIIKFKDGDIVDLNEKTQSQSKVDTELQVGDRVRTINLGNGKFVGFDAKGNPQIQLDRDKGTDKISTLGIDDIELKLEPRKETVEDFQNLAKSSKDFNEFQDKLNPSLDDRAEQLGIETNEKFFNENQKIPKQSPVKAKSPTEHVPENKPETKPIKGDTVTYKTKTGETKTGVVSGVGSRFATIEGEKGQKFAVKDLARVSESHNQTETNNDIESLPISQRVTPEDVEGVDFKRSTVANSVKTERVNSKTGFTKTQAEWFVDEIQKLYDIDLEETPASTNAEKELTKILNKHNKLNNDNNKDKKSLEIAGHRAFNIVQTLNRLNLFLEQGNNEQLKQDGIFSNHVKRLTFFNDAEQSRLLSDESLESKKDFLAKRLTAYQEEANRYKKDIEKRNKEITKLNKESQPLVKTREKERADQESKLKSLRTIDVPGDGTFTFYSKEGIDAIHKKLTGKTVEEFRESDDKTFRPKSELNNFDKIKRESARPSLGKPSKQRQEDLALEQRYTDLSGKEFEIETDKDRADIKKRIDLLENPQRKENTATIEGWKQDAINASTDKLERALEKINNSKAKKFDIETETREQIISEELAKRQSNQKAKTESNSIEKEGIKTPTSDEPLELMQYGDKFYIDKDGRRTEYKGEVPRFYVHNDKGNFEVIDSSMPEKFQELKTPREVLRVGDAVEYVKQLRSGEVQPELRRQTDYEAYQARQKALESIAKTNEQNRIKNAQEQLESDDIIKAQKTFDKLDTTSQAVLIALDEGATKAVFALKKQGFNGQEVDVASKTLIKKGLINEDFSLTQEGQQLVYDVNRAKDLQTEIDKYNDPLRKIADSKTKGDIKAQKNLNDVENVFEILPKTSDEFFKVNGDEVKLSLEAGELFRVASSEITKKELHLEPNIEGQFLDPEQLKAYKAQLDEIAEVGKEEGYDVKPIEDLSKALTKASEANGTVRLNVFNDSRIHETGHQVDYLAAIPEAKALVQRVGGLNGKGNVDAFISMKDEQGDTPIQSIVDNAQKNYFKKHGYTLDTPSQRAVVVQEIWNHVQTGDGARLKLTPEEEADFQYFYMKAFVARNGESVLDSFDAFYKQYNLGTDHLNKVREEIQNPKGQANENKQEIAPKENESVKPNEARPQTGNEDAGKTSKSVSSGTGKATSQTQSTTDRRLSDESRIGHRQYAETLREHGADVYDVEYEKETERGWSDNARKIIADSFNANPKDPFRQAINEFNNSSQPASFRAVLGTALIDTLGAHGEYAEMRKVADKTVEIVGTAAQALRASQMVSKYDFEKGIQIATKALAKEDKALTDNQIEELKNKTGRYSVANENEALNQAILDEAKAELARVVFENRELENALDAITASEKAKTISLEEARKQAITAKRLATLYKNKLENQSEPTKRQTPANILKKTLEPQRAELEQLLKDAFPDTPLRSITDGSEVSSEKTKLSEADVLAKFKQTNFVDTDIIKGILGEYPQYLDDVVKFLVNQRQKLLDGKITVRDVAKAYYMTVASQGSDAISTDIVTAKTGITFPDRFTSINKSGQRSIRPEEAAAWWLATPNGQKALNDLEKGIFNESAWKEGAEIRKAFGDDRFKTFNALGMPRKGQFSMQNISGILDLINGAKGDSNKLQNIVQKLNGIAVGKAGFIKHLLGVGNTPTIDAVEMNLWLTGKGEIGRDTSNGAEMVRTLKKKLTPTVTQAVADRISNRFDKLRREGVGGSIPKEVYNHVMHHWLWDRAKGIETTHSGLYEAQNLYKITDDTVLTDAQEAAVIKLATLDILDHKPYKDTLEAIETRTNGILSDAEVRAIHAEAVNAIRPEKVDPTTLSATELAKYTKAKAERKIRSEHFTQARRFEKSLDANSTLSPLNRKILKRVNEDTNLSPEDKEKLSTATMLIMTVPGAKAWHEVFADVYGGTVSENNKWFKKAMDTRENIKADIKKEQLANRAKREDWQGSLPDFESALTASQREKRDAQRALNSHYSELNKPTWEKYFDAIMFPFDMMRTAMSTMDLSQPGRQGFPTLLTFSTEWAKSLKGLKTGLGNPDKRFAFIKAIEQSPRFKESVKYGMPYASFGENAVGDEHFPTDRFINRLKDKDYKISKVPVLGTMLSKVAGAQQKFEHAYTDPADIQRFGVYSALAGIIDSQGLTDAQAIKAKKWAVYYAKILSGKGSMSKLLGETSFATKMMARIGFAPNLLLSRVETAFHFNPIVASIVAPTGLKATMFKKGLRMYAIPAILALALSAIFKPDDDDDKEATWLDVLNPKSKRFMKVSIRGTDINLDVSGGMSEYQRAMFYDWANLIYGAKDGKEGFINNAKTLAQNEANTFASTKFFRGKASPGVGLGIDLATGSDFLGRPVNRKEGGYWGAVTNRYTPIGMQNFYNALFYDENRSLTKEPQTFELMTQRPQRFQFSNILPALVLGALEGIGVTATQYDKMQGSVAEDVAWGMWKDKYEAKDPQVARINTDLRNLYRKKNRLLSLGKDTAPIDNVINDITTKYKNLKLDLSKIKGQAKQDKFEFVTKDFTADQVKQVLQVASESEQRILNKILQKKESKEKKK